MSQIRSKNTKPEELVRKYLISKGYRYRKNDARLPGKPDIVLPKYKTVIFINGCFWHAHEGCKYFVWPKDNADFWKKKIEGNVLRDRKNFELLAAMGWKVVTIWECELKKSVVCKTLVRLEEELRDINTQPIKVICFGDSNTYGYDPRGYFGERYDENSRWVDILAAETGWTISNMGQNGREIPAAAPAFPADTDLLIIMLGTNDLLQGRSPKQAAERLECFLSGISLDRNKILLVAPLPMALGEWVSSSQLIDDSRTFAQLCQTLAGRLGTRFADAGKWDIPLAYDGVHFTEQGHKAFAAGLLEELR